MRLFQGMRESLREADVVGWYRHRAAPRCVLSARPQAPGSGTEELIEQRIGAGLRQGLPGEILPPVVQF